MTANDQEHRPHNAVPPPGADDPYDTRLVTRIPQALDQRLRVCAALSGKSITRVLAELLAGGLPTNDQLAAQLQRRGRPDEH